MRVLLIFICSCRYAHCSVQRPDGEIVAYGGFGCSSTDGLHSRMNSMIGVAVSDSEPKVRDIELCGDEPGTCATVAIMKDYQRALVVCYRN